MNFHREHRDKSEGTEKKFVYCIEIENFYREHRDKTEGTEITFIYCLEIDSKEFSPRTKR